MKGIRVGIVTVTLVLLSMLLISIQTVSLVVSINAKNNSEILAGYTQDYYRAETELYEELVSLNKKGDWTYGYASHIKQPIINEMYLVWKIKEVNGILVIDSTSLENHEPWKISGNINPWDGG